MPLNVILQNRDILGFHEFSVLLVGNEKPMVLQDRYNFSEFMNHLSSADFV